jgi:hypothetical protein
LVPTPPYSFGLQLPHDVALVGFQWISWHLTPSISSVCNPPLKWVKWRHVYSSKKLNSGRKLWK